MPNQLPEGPSKSIHELMGLPPGHALAERLDTPEGHTSAILAMSERVLGDDQYRTVQQVKGEKFYVSKGNEHFSDHVGVVDKAFEDTHILGFTLWQKVAKNKEQQTLHPVLLVPNGDIVRPVATFQQGYSSSICMGSEMTAPSGDDLSKISEVVASIAADSIDKARQEAEQRSSFRRRLGRSAVAVTAAVASVAALAAVAPSVRGQYGEWRQARADSAEAEREQARAEQLQRDNAIRLFDRTYTIVDDSLIGAGKAGVADPSIQFERERAPWYMQSGASPEVGGNIDAPRTFKAPKEADCVEWEVPIEANDSFAAVHDGGGNQVYTLFPDHQSNTLKICHSGIISTESGISSIHPANEITIQRQSAE